MNEKKPNLLVSSKGLEVLIFLNAKKSIIELFNNWFQKKLVYSEHSKYLVVFKSCCSLDSGKFFK